MSIIIIEILTAAVLMLIVGCFVGFYVRKAIHEKELDQARDTADGILASANKEAANLKKEKILEAQAEVLNNRQKVEDEIKDRRKELSKQENRLLQREETLDRKDSLIEQKEAQLAKREESLDQQQNQLTAKDQEAEKLIAKRKDELYQVAQLTQAEARDMILDNLNNELTHERAQLIQDSDEKVKNSADKYAKKMIVEAIQRSAADTVSETTVSVINLPNDEMKGRIIGREGRNIRSFEALTGIDLIIDDTPEVVVLSGFDPIRREIAKRTHEKLIEDGRIHPARIEEMVDKARKEVNDEIYQAGESALIELGIHNMHPELIKILGRLKYRTSYGQNVLDHSIEVAKVTSALAAELGLDEKLAVRAGLLHDIGKAVDHEIEGTHVEIGVELAKKYHEPEIVVNAIASHHGDVAPISLISVLVSAADSISSARPGARSESLENYIRRLEKLEEIANSYDGVKTSYAIQAGREIRIMVEPDEISDDQMVILARDIKNQIETELEYPGNIKVTLIREKRTVEVAK